MIKSLSEQMRHGDAMSAIALTLGVPANVFGPGRLFGWNRCREGRLFRQGAPCVMELNLHANATTTPKVRAYIQRSKSSVAELASELLLRWM